jgi:hypothetical protein
MRVSAFVSDCVGERVRACVRACVRAWAGGLLQRLSVSESLREWMSRGSGVERIVPVGGLGCSPIRVQQSGERKRVLMEVSEIGSCKK